MYAALLNVPSAYCLCDNEVNIPAVEASALHTGHTMVEKRGVLLPRSSCTCFLEDIEVYAGWRNPKIREKITDLHHSWVFNALIHLLHAVVNYEANATSKTVIPNLGIASFTSSPPPSSHPHYIVKVTMQP